MKYTSNSTDVNEHKQALAAYDEQKPLRKSEVMKLKPGTWIEVKWKDAPNSAALLLSKPEHETGDVELRCFYPNSNGRDWSADTSQVIRVIGPVQIPVL